MKKIIFRIISFALLLACMAVIFAFSAENAERSSGTSGRFARAIARIFINDFEEMPEAKQAGIVKDLQGVVRTSAHFAIYALLGFLAVNAVVSFRLKPYLKPLASFLFCVAYAVSDEIHQRFVSGRACQLSDVAVDALGSLFGIASYLLIIYLLIKIKNRRNKNDKESDPGRPADVH